MDDPPAQEIQLLHQLLVTTSDPGYFLDTAYDESGEDFLARDTFRGLECFGRAYETDIGIRATAVCGKQRIRSDR
jgi:hypothetical protein